MIVRPRRGEEGEKRTGQGVANEWAVFAEPVDFQAKTALAARCLMPTVLAPSGSAGRIRTYDQPINSRLLYH